MSLPMLTRCCGCIPLEIGCVLLTLLSIASCIGNILVGALRLPSHKSRQPEDNLICMSMVMFSTLSALTNLMILGGIWAKRPGYLQFAMLFNFLFIMFCFMVGIVTCLFSPEFAPYLATAGGVALVIAAMLGGAAYCIYFLMVVNSTYRKMKLTYEFSDSAVPV